tara:strand:- start:12936 stop:13583 length:648 start_codon:yes stop_codon:yes gene_type:complete
MKTCTKCKEIKCDTEFHKNKRTAYGLADYCKPCKSAYGKRNKYERTLNDKQCCVCNETKPASEYHSHTCSTDGLQGRCKSCAFLVQQKSKEKTGVHGFLKDRLRNAKANAKRKQKDRSISVEITHEHLIELYEKQKGLCALSGIEMTHISYNTNDFRVKNPHNISLDRIDSSKGYTPDNVQLVCCIINYMKWDNDMDVFLDACKRVVDFGQNNGI